MMTIRNREMYKSVGRSIILIIISIALLKYTADVACELYNYI